MRTPLHSFAAAAISFFGLQVLPPELSASADLKVSHQARALQPGEVVEVTVESEQPLKSLQGQIFERTLPFFSNGDPGIWRGLIGIDLEIKPGVYTLRLNGTRQNGNPVDLQHSLAVKGKVFPTRHLTVEEKFVNPPPEVQERIRQEGKRVEEILATVSPRKIWNGAFAVPVHGKPISSFGKRSILNGQPRSPHSGTDFDADIGTPVAAPNSGKVVLAGDLYFSGNTVILDHGLGLYSYYAHLSTIFVKEGMEVKRGALLGRVGATGRVTGPHLHWSIRLVRARVDPFSLVAVLSK